MKNIRVIKDLHDIGITGYHQVVYNPSYEELYQAEMSPKNKGFEKGIETSSGCVAVSTGIFTGRSPKDRYIVEDDITRDTIHWGDINLPTTKKTWDHCKGLVLKQLSTSKKLYVVDAFCGTNPDTRLKVRFIMEVPWQAHFVTNMFIRPSIYELENFGEPDFVVMNGSKTANNKWQEQGLNSENFVMFNLTEKIQIIGGTWYGGEMKKGMFAMMNYYLPLKGMASMHCSANVGEDGDVAVFFGLSGTGKTTLSADPKRYLIGDDEHGWDDQGVFNYEGGCYAKTINLTEEKEPDIWRAIKRDALLENVVVEDDGVVDFDDNSITENTRVSYPIYHINKIVLPSKAALSHLSLSPTEWKSAEWAAQQGLFAKVVASNEELEKEVNDYAQQMAQFSAKALKEMKKMLWEGTEDWDELLAKRASVSGQLVLSEETRAALQQFKNK